MKDMPGILPEGLTIGCIPEREDPRDVLISKSHKGLDELPKGAIVGTSSLRRKAQILKRRPDLQVKWIRGNIDTRLRKLQTEDYDAIILAAAGLSRRIERQAGRAAAISKRLQSQDRAIQYTYQRLVPFRMRNHL